MEMITANSNPKIKYVTKLNKSASFRNEEGVFVVEGIRMFAELKTAQVKQCFVSKFAYERYQKELDSFGLNDVGLTIVSDGVFQTISQTKSPQGLLAVVSQLTYEFNDLISVTDKSDETACYLILESIQDPGNLGTILRTAEAAGVTGVLIGGVSCDMYNPKVVRSTMGTIFRVPFVYVDDLPAAVKRLQQAGVTVYGAHLDGLPLYQETLAKRSAFLIGNEGNGLSQELSACADRLLRIPMEGQVESLNAAVSASLLAYEAYRQRA